MPTTPTTPATKGPFPTITDALIALELTRREHEKRLTKAMQEIVDSFHKETGLHLTNINAELVAHMTTLGGSARTDMTVVSNVKLTHTNR